ncbi:hypothetical protein A8W25_26395 [Streptomyces sp. ERV7]|uniref:hypothetical protein n=1 Tax=Streptomyces sp. ERV7 TaxID=1322334 RepID=UPI0007F3A19B|nr:hypothetical protein [Streptomyces sp. ERV7]OAR23055.1 hypothetical protein A8W25_26395 [Streptomyces sp. ERV7]
MLRRLAVVLVSLSAAACLTAGTATAVSSDESPELTPREQAGLQFAGHVLGSLFGGSPLRGAGL